jgi:acyl-CoA synthetase (AMP-forming)/AMP-acid ligase II/acyl carrier protein
MDLLATETPGLRPKIRPKQIFGLLQAQANLRGSSPALESLDGRVLTYSELFALVSRIVSRFRDEGVSPTSRVGIVLPNGFDMSVTLLGVCCAGIAVPFNPNHQASEYRQYFTITNVEYLVCDREANSPARPVAAELGIEIIELREPAWQAGTDGRIYSNGLSRQALEDNVAMILMTSGSTGAPKRVPLTHRNLSVAAYSVCDSLSLNPRDLCLSMWEQYHIGGIADLLLAPIAGGCPVLCAGSFNAKRFYELLEKREPTWFQGVPATLRELLVYGKQRDKLPKGSSLRFLRSVAAALPKELMQDLEQYFGVSVIQTFGMTEAAPLITTNLLPPGRRKPGSVGKPFGPEVSVTDGAGRPLPTGKHGEIAVRGENVFAGYEADSDTNASVFKAGWFYTGDVGYIDEDGFLFLVGRSKEMINRGGEKIFPYEIEEILSRHPDVSQVAAFAIPHPTLGEDVGVAVVLKENKMLDEDTVRSFVAERLTDFKVPRAVAFMVELPRCPLGKVRRGELSSIFLEARTKRKHASPQDELHRLLAKLWMTELYLKRVSIDEEFSELGGDSLSRIRVLFAIDELMGITLPESILIESTTIRELAEKITATCHAVGIKKEHVLTLCRSKAKLDLAPILAFQSNDNAFRDYTLTDIHRRLLRSRSINEFNALLEALLTRMLPVELYTLAAEKTPLSKGEVIRRYLRDVNAFRFFKAYKSWRKDVRRELDTSSRSLDWVRQEITPDIHLYSSRNSDPRAKTLIVGFCGGAQRLGLPIYQVLMYLDIDSFDVMTLRDPNRRHYVFGMPNLGTDIGSLCECLNTKIEEMNYSEVISIGSSSGALASLCAGVASGWKRAVALAPLRPSEHPEIESHLSKHANHTSTEVVVYYGARNADDAASAEELKRVLPGVTLRGDPACRKHNFLHYCLKKGRLGELFSACFG